MDWFVQAVQIFQAVVSNVKGKPHSSSHSSISGLLRTLMDQTFLLLADGCKRLGNDSRNTSDIGKFLTI